MHGKHASLFEEPVEDSTEEASKGRWESRLWLLKGLS